MGAIENFSRNLAHVPDLTQCTSLLTRPKPHSYRKSIGPQNRVRNPGITAEHKMIQANLRPQDHQHVIE
jgi:hypothetical protein